MLWTLFYFIVALLLLIVVHESGHFLMARCLGVKVERFSFGFGKVLASWRDKRGTEYALSLVPLGGYVKMLDETIEKVTPKERHMAFNNQPPWAQILIVLAGPLFNFILAFCLLWMVLVIGVKSLAPIIDTVKPGSIAAASGLTGQQEIVAFDGRKITTWREVEYGLMPLVGSQSTIALTVQSLQNNQRKTVFLPLKQWQIHSKHKDGLASLGIVPFIPKIPPIIGQIAQGSPAEKSGLKMNDVIVSVDGKVMKDWILFAAFIKAHPGKSLVLIIKRDGLQQTHEIQVGTTTHQGIEEGYLGVASKPVDWPPNWLRVQREGPFPAIGLALRQTLDLTTGSFALVGRLIIGRLSLQNISGPVGIAKGAGESARGGLVYYLSFIALLSISLGVLNLLPIPMLDGGHLLYYLVELIARRPLSTEFKSKSAFVGLMVLVLLMAVAFKNDLKLIG